MGYAGVNCDSCAQGFHSVGNKCAANLPCTPESCNGHGSCNDQLGYPICTCFQGYATVGTNSCSVCAQGASLHVASLWGHNVLLIPYALVSHDRL